MLTGTLLPQLVVKVRASNQSTNDLSVPSNFTEMPR